MDSKVEVTGSALARPVVSLGEPVDAKVKVTASLLASFVDSVGEPVDSRFEVSASALGSFVDSLWILWIRMLRSALVLVQVLWKNVPLAV